MLGIVLERESVVPLRRQIYTALKERMMEGSLKAGEALPSTRELARGLAVSRNTVCEAVEMLIAEGFAQSRAGAPTRVAPGLCLNREAKKLPPEHTEKRLIEVDFHTGRPDLALFPHSAFAQALGSAARQIPPFQLGYTGPQGSPGLRDEIASWLYRSRGILAEPEDIFITAGATHGLHVIGDLLYRPKGRMMVEDPCHTGLMQTFIDRGYQIIPAGVDRHGIRTEFSEARELCAVYVTPSHQFPLGGILPAARRVELIRYSRHCGCYIIEDDYDSEFRYGAEPVAPLFTMDAQQVIYVGTFSKTMFPALRLGFVILPRPLQPRWRALRTHTDVQSPPWEQDAMAQILRTRKFDRHVHRMRNVYGRRREALLKSLDAAFGSGWEPWGDAAGLHLAAAFRDMRFDEAFMADCLGKGLRVVSVASHCIQKGVHEDKLLLGFGHLQPEMIERGVALLKGIITSRTERR